MNIAVQFMNKFSFLKRRHQLNTVQNISEIGKPFTRIFSGGLIPKTSLLLSVCMHLIGVSIIGLSSVKMTGSPNNAMQVDVFSTPSPKRALTFSPTEKSTPKLILAKPINLYHPPYKTVFPATAVLKTKLQQVPTMPVPVPLDDIFALNGQQNSLSEIKHPINVSVQKKHVYMSSADLSPQRSEPISHISSSDLDQIQLTPVPLNIPSFTEPTQNATFLKKVDPIYPESARLTHKQGSVVLEATIGVDGKAYNIQVVEVLHIRGLGCEEAAIHALKSSLFTPAKQGKVVVNQRLRIPYRFNLKG